MGSALVDKLLNYGYKVIGIGRKEQGLLSTETFNHPNFSFHKADLTSDKLDDIQDEIHGVFHLASVQPDSHLSFSDYYSGNVLATLNILEFTKQRKIPFFVYTSTTTVLDKLHQGQIMDEHANCAPTNYYGISKYTAERLVDVELQNTSTKGIVLRLPSLYGKKSEGGLVYTYFKAALENTPIQIYGNGQKLRNILYIDDVVQLLFSIINQHAHLASFEVFMAGSNYSLKMIEIANIICQALNSKSDCLPIDKPTNPNTDIVIDVSKAKQLLDFAPKSIEENLNIYIKEMLHGA